jgi:hypothetical protein
MISLGPQKNPLLGGLLAPLNALKKKRSEFNWGGVLFPSWKWER